MIGLFWNIRGLGNLEKKKGHLQDLMKDHSVDFVGIVETIKQNFSDNFLQSLAGAKNFS